MWTSFHLLMTDMRHKFDNKIEWRGDTLQIQIVSNQHPCLHRDSWHLTVLDESLASFAARGVVIIAVTVSRFDIFAFIYEIRTSSSLKRF